MKRNHRRLLLVAVYALAMAWVEAAVVLYLRTLFHRIVPYQLDPLPFQTGLARVELPREAATLIMLASVGALAGATPRARLGFFLIGFGLWDIFYYVFLRIMCGWPSSLWDWDVLFLIPLPWWGPVAAPCLIASLMILFGFWLSSSPRAYSSVKPRFSSYWLVFAGSTAALVIFMKDSLGAVANGQGISFIGKLLPEDFPWTQFLVCLAMMSAPLWEVAWLRLGSLLGSFRPSATYGE